MHVGPTNRKGYVGAIVERVNSLQADVVAVTGDLFDGSVQELAAHVAPLAGLASRHVLRDLQPRVLQRRRCLGVRVLINAQVLLHPDGDSLALAGVPDATLVRLQQPFTAGLKRWYGLWVCISRGTGYWGPPKRLGAPSEIAHLRLVTA